MRAYGTVAGRGCCVRGCIVAGTGAVSIVYESY
jgi:hypothetical protein